MTEENDVLESTPGCDSHAAERLLPIVYKELRALAAQKMARETPGHTLQPTALVHEAWLRMAGEKKGVWASRAQFFAAAAEAMRRILVESARRRQALKRGGTMDRESLEDSQIAAQFTSEELLEVHEALDGLAAEDSVAAELVKLRYFAGMTMAEAALALDLPVRTSERLWQFAKAWLRRELRGGKPGVEPNP
jgi:RNA polymerase sigma factor (TIGR02999 family)